MMANNTNPQDNPEYIQELLSPYLDGEVTDEERVLVEQAIATSPELQQELESLRQTVAMVQALPPMPAPRPFTLSEADVQSVAPAPKKSFWLSGWAGGLALLATTLVCVLVAGGIFFNTRFGQGALAPAEIANLDQAAAPEAAETEVEAAAAEPAAEKAVEEEAVVEEEAAPAEARQEAAATAPPIELEMEKEAESAESADTLAEEDAVTITEAEGEAAGEVADDSAENVGQADAIEEQEEAVGRDADTGGIGGGGEPVTGAVQATAVPSPLPVATPTLFPQATSSPPEAYAVAPPAPAEATEEEALAEEEPAVAQSAPASEAIAEEPEEDALADAEAPAAEPEDEQSQAFREGNVRPVEIQNQRLRVEPGFIQIEGIIEASPGTALVASLQRNGNIFEGWAAPASLQSVVQPDGQFSFSIQANPGRTDVDLFSIEPADYQIIITSVGGDTPVAATVHFDTFGAPTTPEETVAPPTLTPTPLPSPTPSPQPTIAPPATPTPIAQAAPVAPPEPASSSQSALPGFLFGAILIGLLVVLVIAGIVIWLVINKKS